MMKEGQGYRAAIRYNDIAPVGGQQRDSLVYKEMLTQILDALMREAVLVVQ